MNRTPGNEHSNPITRAFSKFLERGKIGMGDTPKPAQRDASRPRKKSATTPSQRDVTAGGTRTGTTARPAAPTAPRASTGRTQGSTAATSPPSAAATTPTATAAPRTYTVVKGDSLSKIAQQVYGRADCWKLIFEANRDQISDPDLIHPGQVLVLPDASKLH